MSENCKYKLISPDTAGNSNNLIENQGKEEGNRRVQALLADWLRMENVVVLTGAGSSVGAGGRLVAGKSETNLD